MTAREYWSIDRPIWVCTQCDDEITQEQALKHDCAFRCVKCYLTNVGVLPVVKIITCPNPECAQVCCQKHNFCCDCGTKLVK